MRCLLVAGLVAAGLAMPSASSAQTTIFLMFDGVCDSAGPCPAPRILQADVERPAIVASWPIACAGTDLRVTADGRFLLWNERCGQTPGRLQARDLVTGGTFALNPAPTTFVAHPSQLQLLWPLGARVVSLTPDGVTLLPGDCPTPPALSGDGSRYAHRQGCQTSTFDIRTTASGSLVGTVDVPGLSGDVALDERGESLFAVTQVVQQQVVRKFAVASGLEVAMRTALGDPIQGAGRLALERRTGRVFLTTNSLVEMFEPVALAPIRAYSAGSFSSPPPVFHPLRSQAFTIAPLAGAAIWIADPAQSNAVAPLPLAADHLVSVAAAPHAPPPIGLTASVTGHRVTLTWSDGPRSPMLTGYDVEVALAPGGPTALTVPVAAPTFVADGVPSGAYYVRVRARNHAGASAASTEAVVTVP